MTLTVNFIFERFISSAFVLFIIQFDVSISETQTKKQKIEGFKVTSLFSNISENGGCIQLAYESDTKVKSVWSHQVSLPTSRYHGASWVVPVSGNPNYSLSGEFETCRGSSVLSQVSAVPGNISAPVFAVSFVNDAGSLYYYKSISPVQFSNSGLNSRQIARQDHVEEYFPPVIHFEDGGSINANFIVSFQKNLNHSVICILVQYLVTCDATARNCKHNVVTKDIMVDGPWKAKKQAAGGILVSKHVQSVQDKTQVKVALSIKSALMNHSGQYVCNIFTDPSSEGASFHTQTKVLHRNRNHTDLLPRGFHMVQLHVCGSVAVSADRKQVTIASGIDNCLHCYSAGHPSKDIVFMKNGTALDHTQDNPVYEPGGLSEFLSVRYVLRSPTPADSGKYTCLSYSDDISLDDAKSSIYINVVE